MRAVLFDLDGTLLDIDIDAFLGRYFAALAPVVAETTGLSGSDGIAAVVAATDTMCGHHEDMTNREAFAEGFLAASGTAIDDAAWERFDRFYAEDFPQLKGDIGPRDGAAEAVSLALGLGLKVAIATNPIFPRAAVDERIRWTGIDVNDVHLVTTYEHMHACKPSPRYFEQTASMLGVQTTQCLMVGDDRVLDMSAADVGMKTFYVGAGPLPECDWAGDLSDLCALLPRIAEGDARRDQV